MLSGPVLVTGASGLIGRNVVNALSEQGAETYALSRTLTHQADAGQVQWLKADLLSHRARIEVLDAVQPRTVIHCAWVTDHGAYWTSPANMDWVGASLSLAREARERGTVRFVGVGTCAEYAWGGDEPLSETTTPLRPATLYGAAKDATRRVLEAYAMGVGLSWAWARVAMLYGAGEHRERFVASLAQSLVRGEPARMASGRAVRDVMDARDVGAAIASVAESSIAGAVNIGSGEPVALLHVAETLARLANRPELLRPGTLADRLSEPERLAVNVKCLFENTAFRPRIPLEQGLADALSWARRA